MSHTAKHIYDNAEVGDLVKACNEIMKSEPISYVTYSDGIYLVVQKDKKGTNWLELKLISGSDTYWLENITLFPYSEHANTKYELLQ